MASQECYIIERGQTPSIWYARFAIDNEDGISPSAITGTGREREGEAGPGGAIERAIENLEDLALLEADHDDYDDSMDGDFDSGMASAGFGTDEDYGFNGDDFYG